MPRPPLQIEHLARPVTFPQLWTRSILADRVEHPARLLEHLARHSEHLARRRITRQHCKRLQQRSLRQLWIFVNPLLIAFNPLLIPGLRRSFGLNNVDAVTEQRQKHRPLIPSLWHVLRRPFKVVAAESEAPNSRQRSARELSSSQQLGKH